jgi:hypothetical protein
MRPDLLVCSWLLILLLVSTLFLAKLMFIGTLLTRPPPAAPSPYLQPGRVQQQQQTPLVVSLRLPLS